ncbi:hypothetical protein A1D29_02430 [Pasteurellaceae bacterium Orientalotternb1]|nr:hypothetical protein A1D29_02430 [Pasteurellaceae bacterium Orientalotternb1]
MSYVKSMAVLLSAVMSISVQAATVSQLYQAKETTPPPAATVEKVQEPPLQQFVNSLELRFTGIKLHSINDEIIVEFNYELRNKTAVGIKRVHWKTDYIADGQTFFTQNEPLIFPQSLASNEPLPLTFSASLKQFPQNIKEILLNQRELVSTQFQAKSIEFSNGTKIIVE